MVRITCDECYKASFEVFTFDTKIDAPEGWMNVIPRGQWSNRAKLCCPNCVAQAEGDSKISKPYMINIEFKNDGNDDY